MVMEAEERIQSDISPLEEAAGKDLRQFHVLGNFTEDTRQIQEQFSDLVELVIDRLDQKKISLKEIIDPLKQDLPEECHQAANLDEFFDKLLPQMVFFSYGILALIIQRLKLDLGNKVAEYDALFKEYCKKRLSILPVNTVVEFSGKAKNPEVRFMKNAIVKLDYEWEQMTIEDMRKFRNKLGEILNIRPEMLQLLSVREGCIELTFSVHGSLLQMILNNGLADDEHRDLCKLRVISISIGTSRIFENLELTLISSCCNGDFDQVSELIDRGVDVNSPLQDGWTALLYASFYGHFRIVRLLLSAGAVVNARNEAGVTPIMASCQNGNIEVVKILLVHHANINDKDLGGWTSLMYATEFNHTNIVQLITEHQVQVNAQNEEKVTALHLACHHGLEQTVKILVGAGARVDIQDQVEDTPLMYACRAGFFEVVVVLLKRGANPEISNKSGLTPLMCAVESQSVKCVKILLEKGVQTCHMEPVSKWTALFVAAKCGNCQIVQLLLNNGADPNKKDKDGITPLEVARVHHHQEVCELLHNDHAEIRQSKNIETLVLATTQYIHRLMEKSQDKLCTKSSKQSA